jgi:uncharacterized protein (TIGR02466 family)
MFTNILEDQIFSSFLVSSEIVIDNDLLINECLTKEKLEDGIGASNIGGFHSQPHDFYDQNYPTLTKLAENSVGFANTVCEKYNIERKIGSLSAWININRANHYNVMHSHNNNILTGVYYVKVPKNDSGDLILYRNDGAEFFDSANSGHHVIKPKEGRLYIFSPWLKHSVTVSRSLDERISIAFNFLPAVP